MFAPGQCITLKMLPPTTSAMPVSKSAEKRNDSTRWIGTLSRSTKSKPAVDTTAASAQARFERFLDLLSQRLIAPEPGDDLLERMDGEAQAPNGHEHGHEHRSAEVGNS